MRYHNSRDYDWLANAPLLPDELRKKKKRRGGDRFLSDVRRLVTFVYEVAIANNTGEQAIDTSNMSSLDTVDNLLYKAIPDLEPFLGERGTQYCWNSLLNMIRGCSLLPDGRKKYDEEQYSALMRDAVGRLRNTTREQWQQVMQQRSRRQQERRRNRTEAGESAGERNNNNNRNTRQRTSDHGGAARTGGGANNNRTRKPQHPDVFAQVFGGPEVITDAETIQQIQQAAQVRQAREELEQEERRAFVQQHGNIYYTMPTQQQDATGITQQINHQQSLRFNQQLQGNTGMQAPTQQRRDATFDERLDTRRIN